MRTWMPDEQAVARRRAEPEAQPDPRRKALDIQRGAGNQAMGRMLARMSVKKVQGGRKVDYADDREEAIRECKKEAALIDIDWDKGIEDLAKETIITHALNPVLDGAPAGMPSARELILSEKREATRKQQQSKRREIIEDEDSDYRRLREMIEGDDILEQSLDWMKDMYIAGETTSGAKRTLGTPYSRAEISSAVSNWRGWDDWVSQNCKMIKDLHGYRVGPKASNVGDTLDTRGPQGNIIAVFGGIKMNIHINPTD